MNPSCANTTRLELRENKIILALISCEPEPLLAQANPVLPDSHFKVVSTLSDLIDRELVATIRWAKRIPGFTDLTLNDQMKLLQTTWAEILSLSLAYRSCKLSSTTPKLMFTSDFIMDEQQATDCQASEYFYRCVKLVKRLDRISIAREEYLALKALLLTNADIQLEDPSSVWRLQDVIIFGLTECVNVLHPSGHGHHLSHLFLCLPLLRQLDKEFQKFWNSIRREGKVPMNKLLVEMLESSSSL